MHTKLAHDILTHIVTTHDNIISSMDGSDGSASQFLPPTMLVLHAGKRLQGSKDSQQEDEAALIPEMRSLGQILVTLCCGEAKMVEPNTA